MIPCILLLVSLTRPLSSSALERVNCLYLYIISNQQILSIVDWCDNGVKSTSEMCKEAFDTCYIISYKC